MALIQCPECKQEISDQAAACPHCGAPRRPVSAAPPPPPPPAPPPAAAPSASAPPASPATPPPTAAAGAAPGRRSGALLLAGLLVVAFGAFAVIQLSGTRRQETPAPPPPPEPRFIIDNVDANESCTIVGEYCVRVRCAVTNAGSAAGISRVAAELNEDSVSIGTRRATRSLAVGQQDTVTFDFPEANLGKQHTFRCYEAPGS